MDLVIARFGVYLIRPGQQRSQRGSEARPVVVISPDEMNDTLGTLIVAPVMQKGPDWPTRVRVGGSKKNECVMLDRIMTIDRSRVIRQAGSLDPSTSTKVASVLSEMFVP